MIEKAFYHLYSFLHKGPFQNFGFLGFGGLIFYTSSSLYCIYRFPQNYLITELLYSYYILCDSENTLFWKMLFLLLSQVAGDIHPVSFIRNTL